MGAAKGLRVELIAAADANRIVKALHYSGTYTRNGQLHFGVFMDGKCGGAMTFGPSIAKRTMAPLVRGTGMNQFLELNRLAFADWLPRNSESRALSYALRWIASEHPHVKWVVSFADATRCGDGTIYRAAGFLLVGIKRNTSMLQMRGKREN